MAKKVRRIYEQFQPEHYDLSLQLDRDTMRFKGTVTVRGKRIGRPSQRFTFHQKELEITAATVTKRDKKNDQALTVSRINNHDSLDEVRLHSDAMIYPGNYTITMEFEGKITKAMNGIYPCFFRHDGQDKKLIATQFESHHAREAFPCVDEPEAKATFDLTLITPAGETVIANTPVKTQQTFASDDGGQTASGMQAGSTTPLYQSTTFETTPKMSTYLLAFVYGEMGYREAKTKDGISVRAYATPDNVRLVDHGMDAAIKTLEFFSEYFGVPYPLKKLDMAALPDFNVGGMENWGLMTFRETAMLADPKTSSIESKQIVALVVAHEVSHQWFGDLVTMKWWDDLWLNESFANLMEYVAVDAIYPEWHIWEQFVSHETAGAKRRDSLADVQPIKCDVNHPDEINTIFDPSIVYAKGATVLRMLMHHIGEEAFRKGLAIYFKEHKYGNTVADDLWQAFSKSSGRDIATFMNGWLERPGYPLVSIDWQPDGDTVNLSQRRFLNDPNAGAVRDEPWQVPLAASQPLTDSLLVKTSAKVGLQAPDDGPLIFNHDSRSYFLPRYTNAAHVRRIVDGVKGGHIDTIDRQLLLDNYILLQRGGQSQTVELLELLQGYEQERNENVWGAIAVAIGEARRLVEGDKSEDRLDAIAQRLVADLADTLGWEDQAKDDAQTLRLRGLTHSIAAGARTKAVIDEGLQRFEDFRKPSDLSASTRTIVYYVGARYGSDHDFQKLFDLYHSTQNADEREEIASALTGVKVPDRYRQLFDMLKTDAVRRQDFFHWYAWLLRNRYTRQSMWRWVRDEWTWIEQAFSSDKNYSYFARYPGTIFSHDNELKEFREFFDPKKSVIALGRDIELAEAEIAGRVAWRQRNERPVRAWLLKQKA